MTDPAADSQVDLILDRHKQLKRQRQNRFLQATWRTLVTLSLAVGLGWAVSQPEWKLRQQSQITISGNDKLSTSALESLLPFSFPLSLIRLEPQRIETVLQKYAHVRQVLVSRKLFPPRVTIFVQERPPVAMTRCDRCLLITDPSDPQALKIGPADTWILDAQGVALPAQYYPTFAKAKDLPSLRMENFLSPLPETAPLQKIATAQNAKPMILSSEKQQQWQRMYSVLQKSPVIKPNSPVQLLSINWQDLANLKLNTKLGEVHLGSNDNSFAKQLQALDEMRSLSTTIDIDQVVYINLQNPDHPDLEMRNPPTPQVPPT
jgi:cell division protein FtsQ